MITLADYFMGRDLTHGLELSTAYRAKAAQTVDIVNQLLAEADAAGVPAHTNGKTGRVRSGWRPSAINAATPKASATSLHMSCEACDIEDPHGELGRWLQTAQGKAVLERLGLWMEEPSYTATWAHVQTRPPPSGRRYFIPR